ncbi:MAG: 8-oxo-dGTP diphosphatase [Clostridiales bacterium]|nr:8-oxo-dGTP diphosphatase [Clostridiales bacterium]
MHKPEKAVFANMCMVYDDMGNVLVQDRVNPNWPGITFPGGHVEAGEFFTDAVIREVFEETGLTISHPQLCGVKQWEEEGCRHVVLCYKTKHYQGELISSAEGKMSWVKIEDMSGMNLAEGMNCMLRLFLEEDISEHCFQVENGKWIDVLK